MWDRLNRTSWRRIFKVENMCFGSCARCVGYKLLILALLCIVANTLLYFPNGETRFASEHHLSKYVECLHGILGGGFLVSNNLVSSFKFILEVLGTALSLLVTWIYSSNIFANRCLCSFIYKEELYYPIAIIKYYWFCYLQHYVALKLKRS